VPIKHIHSESKDFSAGLENASDTVLEGSLGIIGFSSRPEYTGDTVLEGSLDPQRKVDLGRTNDANRRTLWVAFGDIAHFLDYLVFLRFT